MSVGRLLIPVLLASAVLALLPGCRRTITIDEPLPAQISFAPGGLQSRAMIESGDLATTGTRLRVYDYVTGFEGTIDGQNGGNPYSRNDVFQFFNDQIQYDPTASWAWKYLSGRNYRWTRKGTHSFFGWMEKDAKSNLQMSDLFGSTPTLAANRTLSIPEVTFTTQSAQFDFSYSDIVSRNVEASGFDGSSPVPLALSHLFSAICITFDNRSDTTVTVNSISIPNFPNKGSATLNYSGNSVSVEGINPVAGATPFYDSSTLSGVTLRQGQQYNIFNGVEDDLTYYLTWPVPQSTISPSTPVGEDPESESIIYASSDSLILVNYTIGGLQYSAKGKFPAEPLTAGKKHHINIQYTNKIINVTATALPWTYTEAELDFSTDAITTPNEGKLNVMPNTCNIVNTSEAHMIPGTNVECYLTIQTPIGATLVINKRGDTEYFEISPSSMTIKRDKMTFYVCPSSLPTNGVERRIQLDFVVVMPSGREIDANYELIDSDRNYTFIRQ